VRRIVLALCLLLAFGAVLAAPEEMVAKDKKQQEKPEKSEATTPAEDAEACEDRAKFNTLEDIFSGGENVLLAEDEEGDDEKDAKAAPAGKTVPTVEWKEVRKEDPQD
jgi:hypothetical protein